MRKPSMQNLTDDLASTKQTLSETPEVDSDLTLVQSKSIKPSQNTMNTNINTESRSVQSSEDITVVQNKSPLSEAENDKTIVQKPEVVEQIGSSSQPTKSVEAIDGTQNHIAQFSLEDDFKNLNAAEVTIVQNDDQTIVQQSDSPVRDHDRTIVQQSDSPVRDYDRTIVQQSDSSVKDHDRTIVQQSDSSVKDHDRTIVQHSNSVVIDRDNTIVQHSDSVVIDHDNTIVQHSNSVVHNPVEQTEDRAVSHLSTNLKRSLDRLEMPQSPHSSIQKIVPKNRAHTLGSFPSRFINITGQFFNSIWRKINLKQPQSSFSSDRQLATKKTLEQPFSDSLDRYAHNNTALDEQPSSEQHQKKLRELDICRLDYAKELARNGNFRKAIAVAQQIPEMSHFFKDAQMLIQSWKQF